MKFVSVDCQGFFNEANTFVLKELAICYDVGFVTHWSFKPQTPFCKLKNDQRKQVRYLEKFHHGLQYSQGDEPYDALRGILVWHLDNVHVIYVKGAIKKQYLERVCAGLLGPNSPTIINIEDMQYVPQLLPINDRNYCCHHSTNTFVCSKYNAVVIYNFVKSFLPLQ